MQRASVCALFVLVLPEGFNSPSLCAPSHGHSSIAILHDRQSIHSDSRDSVVRVRYRDSFHSSIRQISPPSSPEQPSYSTALSILSQPQSRHPKHCAHSYDHHQSSQQVFDNSRSPGNHARQSRDILLFPTLDCLVLQARQKMLLTTCLDERSDFLQGCGRHASHESKAVRAYFWLKIRDLGSSSRTTSVEISDVSGATLSMSLRSVFGPLR